jgi:hypothetical protein
VEKNKMKENKLKNLFGAARKEPAPEAPFTFSQNVVSAIRREANPTAAPCLADQLNALFPRLAWAAVLIISACVMSEIYFSRSGDAASTEMTQAAEEWLYASN